MARASQTASRKNAGHVAAQRRHARRDGENTSARAAKSAPGKNGKKARPQTTRRAGRFVLLMLLMALIGFFTVMVIDVAVSIVGKVSLGETTVDSLWDKVVDRVLDRDVPRVAPQSPRRAAPSRAKQTVAPVDTLPTHRAPLPAQRPELDARHVQAPPHSDAQVDDAQRRLDALLKRL